MVCMQAESMQRVTAELRQLLRDTEAAAAEERDRWQTQVAALRVAIGARNESLADLATAAEDEREAAIRQQVHLT